MIVCKECGVELDAGMDVCPLCGTSITASRKIIPASVGNDVISQRMNPGLLKQLLWQIASVLLLSGIIATLVINLAMVGRVTWSVYPIVICLIALSYATLMALWRVRIFIQVLAGWVLSGLFLTGVEIYTGDRWPVFLALPLLSAVNLICLALILILNIFKVKGLNVLAVMFVAIAALCLIVEAILSLYFDDQIKLGWSVIVAACLLPVTAAIMFMYFRTRNNSELQKIFHT